MTLLSYDFFYPCFLFFNYFRDIVLFLLLLRSLYKYFQSNDFKRFQEMLTLLTDNLENLLKITYLSFMSIGDKRLTPSVQFLDVHVIVIFREQNQKRL